MAIVSKTTALLLLCTAVIASGSMAPNPSPRRTGSGSGSGSGSTTLAPTLAPSNAPTKYPTGAPANTPTSTPTVGYTAAATQITQTIVQTIPGVESAATFNAEPNVKSAYEKGYGSQIGVTDTASNGAVTYKTGCSVDAWAADATRRAAMNVQYSSVVSDASGVDTTTASNGVTDTSAFAAAVATVVASDTTTYAAVTAPSASDITAVASAVSVSVEGGTVSPTSAPNNDSDLDTFIIIVAVVGAVILLGLIVMIVVNFVSKPNKEETFRAEAAAADKEETPAAAEVPLAVIGVQAEEVPAVVPEEEEKPAPAETAPAENKWFQAEDVQL